MDACMKKVYSRKREKVIEREEKKRIFHFQFHKGLFVKKEEPKHNITKIHEKRLKIPLRETMNHIRENYRKTFCNPSCKDTIFEDGLSNKLSKSFLKDLKKEAKYKDRSDWTKVALRRRKNIFKGKKAVMGKKSVLDNNFHVHIDAKTRKKLTDSGAISGCYLHNPYNPLTKPVL